ncbi:Uncharacterised protein [Vibrio cholerae]|nr:Uncharacterised protein [Vibrio cholerae]
MVLNWSKLKMANRKLSTVSRVRLPISPIFITPNFQPHNFQFDKRRRK